MKSRRFQLALIVLIAVAGTAALAERTRDLGRFVVHYAAMPTAALDARVARTHAIERAADIGMLNVAVAKKQAGDRTIPVTATITADVSDHTGNINMLSMREIRDGEAVYYVGEFPIRSREPLQFHITVSPESSGPPYVLQFQKQFMLK